MNDDKGARNSRATHNSWYHFCLRVVLLWHLIESNASKEKIVFESNIRIIIKNLGLRQDKQSDCMKMYLFCEAARGEGAARRRYWDCDQF